MSGLSSILSILALAGFVLFIAGAGLAVVAASQGRPARGGVILAVLGLIIGLLFSVVGQGIIIVEPTEVAVVVNTLTGSVEQPKRAGLHIVIPISQRVAITYPITQLEYTMSSVDDAGGRVSDVPVEARTSDGQTVLIDVTVIFRIAPEQADDLYLSWNENYLDGFVRPTSRSIIREVVSAYSAEQIYGEARVQLGDDIEESISTRFTEEHLELTDLLVRGITFSPDFTEAIEQKVVAEQNLERARTEAQRVQTEAGGQAQAQIARAEGEAQSRTIRAAAEAEALRLISEQISANPSLIQYQYVQTLSDNVELILIPSNSPFLFDLESLAAGAGAGGFTAPTVDSPLVITPEPTETPASP
jgi:regulator of protease activity HflC (stomatin/prohibitin superfamily)